MYEIKTMNNIARQGLNVLSAKGLLVNNEAANPDGLLLRSAKIHDMEFGDRLLAISRAGVGTDNVPVERCTEEGIVVFNAAGGNAQAVVEMAVGALVLASRDLMEGAMWAKSLAGHENVDKEVEAGKKAFVGPEIMGKTLGIIGLGIAGMSAAGVFSQKTKETSPVYVQETLHHTDTVTVMKPVIEEIAPEDNAVEKAVTEKPAGTVPESKEELDATSLDNLFNQAAEQIL